MLRDSRYHVGDRVVVRSDLKQGMWDADDDYGNGYLYCAREMVDFAGGTFAIKCVEDRGEGQYLYELSGTGYIERWSWTASMFEGLESDVDQSCIPDIDDADLMSVLDGVL